MVKKKNDYLELEKDIKKNSQIITGISTTIRTLEAALKAAEVDLSIWEVERHTINKWDSASKTASRAIAERHWVKDITVTELWQVKIYLKRKLVRSEIEALNAINERIKARKPLSKSTAPRIKTQTHLLEIALMDVHFGKLAWGPETGEDYDLELSKSVYLNAAEDLIQRTDSYNIEQILLPIGNDFFHVNNWQNTTEKGTQQDVDTRMSKIFEIGCDAVVSCIERCLKVAPVNVLWVPGNHDPETSWYLAKVIQAYYRNVSEVRVNKDPTFRKYVGYGVNLIGFTHGNEEPHQALPTIMATEQPDLWAKSTTRTWHIGHYHKKAETRYAAGDTFNGVSVQIIPSLSGVDAWHYRKGYVKGNRAAEAYLWSYTDGYVGHFSANVRI